MINLFSVSMPDANTAAVEKWTPRVPADLSFASIPGTAVTGLKKD